MRTALRQRGPIAMGALTAVLYASSVSMGFQSQTGDLSEGITWGGAALSMALIGTLLLARRPGNRIGWMLLLYGFLQTLAGWAELYGEYPAATGVELPFAVGISWVIGSVWVVSGAILLVYLPLNFPTGLPPSPRWRWVGWIAAAGVALSLVSTLYVAVLRPELMPLGWDHIEQAAPELAGLFTISDLGYPLLMAAGPLAVVSLIVRFVRSRGEERQQIKLLAFAGTLTVLFVISISIAGDLPRGVEVVGTAISMPSIGIATMVAVLRYRLFEIDRVVSRTLTYALLSLLLVGIYLGAVTVLTAATTALSTDSPVAVAAATLVAAAAFQPTRRRIQAMVDRRFNRARYDARRTVEAFASSLRQEVDLDDVRGHLLETVDDVLQPQAVTIWWRTGSPA